MWFWACAAFAWAAWINLIDFVFHFSPSRAVPRALNDVNKPKRLGTRLIPGYNFFRSDRQDRLGGGVGIYVKNSIPVKRLFEYETVDRESLWLVLRPPRLPRQASLILYAVIYHTTASNSQDNSDCLAHIQNNVDSFVNAHPDALVVITGDFNPNSTNLNEKLVKQTESFLCAYSITEDCF